MNEFELPTNRILRSPETENSEIWSGQGVEGNHLETERLRTGTEGFSKAAVSCKF